MLVMLAWQSHKGKCTRLLGINQISIILIKMSVFRLYFLLFNSLGPSDTIWQYLSTFVQVLSSTNIIQASMWLLATWELRLSFYGAFRKPDVKIICELTCTNILVSLHPSVSTIIVTDALVRDVYRFAYIHVWQFTTICRIKWKSDEIT